MLYYPPFIGGVMMFNPGLLMVQGTTSDAGKSILVTALCRIMARHGYQVAPFKSQNMALNSAVTEDGGEIGRAQAVQALAANKIATVEMNPVLLKPNSDIGAQVIVRGKAIGNMKAKEYHQFKPQLLHIACESLQTLQKTADFVFIEGAGSPAEINLRDRDIVNMGLAEAVNCPVIIIADIDRGGVFAHLVGTYQLLSETEQKHVVGFVINRFRGDLSLLRPGIDWLQDYLKVPVLAVIPYIDQLYIEAEDAIDFSQVENEILLNICVLAYPRMSNHTDFDALRFHPNIKLRFIRSPNELQPCDLLILPGTKCVSDDLHWLKNNAFDRAVTKHLRYGGKLLGICGGYQMLGKEILDPDGIETQHSLTLGLGFIDMNTQLMGQKSLTNMTGKCLVSDQNVKGYEIHVGQSTFNNKINHWFRLTNAQTGKTDFDGFISEDNCIRGTYLHGLFDEKGFLESIFQWCEINPNADFDYNELKHQEINRLADIVEEVISHDLIKSLTLGTV